MAFVNHGEVALVVGNKKGIFLLGLIVCFLAALFCFLGYAQAVWLSATPNYDADRASYNVKMWGISSLVLFGAGVLFCTLLYKSSKTGKRQNK